MLYNYNGKEEFKMKKILPLLSTLALLAACANKGPSNLDVSVLCPTGAPALAFYNYANDSKFETNANASEGIVPSMLKGDKDVVILPTNAGVNAISKKSAPYKLAATITFGNIYLAATGHDTDGTLNDGDYIVLFSQGQVPDLLFHYVFGDTLDSNAHYVPSGTEAAKVLKAGKNMTSTNEDVDYVLIAEPALQNVMNTTPNVTIAKNIQTEYKTKSNGLDIFQASVFVNNNLEKDKAKSFLKQLEGDIKAALKDSNKVKEGLAKSENLSVQYGVPSVDVVDQSFKNNNSMGLGYKSAKENKATIDNFLSLFNIEATNEEIYYRTQE